MEEHNGKKKIVVGLMNPQFKQNEPDKKFTDEFLSKLYTIEEEFREKLLLPINEKIGIYNWALFFGNAYNHFHYFVTVYSNTIKEYGDISAIVKEKLPDLQLQFDWKPYATYS